MIGQIVAGILRTILMTVGGAQVGQGWLTNDQLQQIVGSVLTLVAVGWQIVAAARRRTKAGGEFNPKAEVRKAQPVRRFWGGGDAGYVRLTALVAAGGWACIGVAFFAGIALAQRGVRQDAGRSDQDGRGTLAGRSGRGAWVVERFPDVTETIDLSDRSDRSDVLRWRVPIDERGFVVRVVDSLGLWGDAGRDKGGAACYAVGVQGGAEF